MANSSIPIIFIVSQTRAGSTLLQRILGSHPDIHTTSEPWLMLHPLYALRQSGYSAEYDARLAREGLRDFLADLPQGEEEYFEAVRDVYSRLYKQALTGNNKRLFLDKTPRYYFIIPDLYRVFPCAKYLILFRNPLAVLCSIVETWVHGKWNRLPRFKSDLLEAPNLLVQGVNVLGEQVLPVWYEELVQNPNETVRAICDHTGVRFDPGMIDYGKTNTSHWRYGDQMRVNTHARPTAEYSERWKQQLTNPQVWRLANDYLEVLGRETIEAMGYSYENLLQTLDQARPSRLRLVNTSRLKRLLEGHASLQVRATSMVVRFQRSVKNRGVNGTLALAVRRLART